MICSWFLQHLKDCFHINLTLMPPHTTWLDFSNKDVPDGICLKGVTLLHKTLCLKEWFKLFTCPQSQQIKVTESVYSCLVLQDATSLLMKLITFNRLRKNSRVAYNKAYNNQKKLFVIILKEHILFDNPVFKALEFSLSQLNQWYTIN